MKGLLRPLLLLAAGAACASCTTAPEPDTGLRLERAAMLMRHGIRPPTSIQPIPAQYAPAPWPSWGTGPGLLTPRGAKGVALLAASDRAYFARAGLLPAAGCPAPGEVSVQASKVPRAIDTAKAWSSAFAPACLLSVAHPAKGEPDALFHPLEAKPAWFAGQRAYEAALAKAPPGGLAGQAKALAPRIRLLARVLGCASPACPLERTATTLVPRPHDRPALHGPLAIGSTASETLLLEYVEGMPLRQVGWGRVSRAEIERLLVFNAVLFDYVDRPGFIARATAGPLARTILAALRDPAGPRLTLLAGHDTNIADLGGLLDIHWQAPSYARDTVPPGSALGFELFSDSGGRRYVRAFIRSQTMDQLRNLEPLTAANPAHRGYVAIPGCGRPTDARSCSLETFTRLVEARLSQSD